MAAPMIFPRDTLNEVIKGLVPKYIFEHSVKDDDEGYDDSINQYIKIYLDINGKKVKLFRGEIDYFHYFSSEGKKFIEMNDPSRSEGRQAALQLDSDVHQKFKLSYYLGLWVSKHNNYIVFGDDNDCHGYVPIKTYIPISYKKDIIELFDKIYLFNYNRELQQQKKQVLEQIKNSRNLKLNNIH